MTTTLLRKKEIVWALGGILTILMLLLATCSKLETNYEDTESIYLSPGDK